MAARKTAKPKVSGVTKFTDLDEESQKALAKEAYDKARELGYCSETANVLEELGFSAGERKVDITVTLKSVWISPLQDLTDRDQFNYGLNIESNDGDVYIEGYSYDIDVVSVVDSSK